MSKKSELYDPTKAPLRHLDDFFFTKLRDISPHFHQKLQPRVEYLFFVVENQKSTKKERRTQILPNFFTAPEDVFRKFHSH